MGHVVLAGRVSLAGNSGCSHNTLEAIVATTMYFLISYVISVYYSVDGHWLARKPIKITATAARPQPRATLTACTSIVSKVTFILPASAFSCTLERGRSILPVRGRCNTFVDDTSSWLPRLSVCRPRLLHPNWTAIVAYLTNCQSIEEIPFQHCWAIQHRPHFAVAAARSFRHFHVDRICVRSF